MVKWPITGGMETPCLPPTRHWLKTHQRSNPRARLMRHTDCFTDCNTNTSGNLWSFLNISHLARQRSTDCLLKCTYFLPAQPTSWLIAKATGPSLAELHRCGTISSKNSLLSIGLLLTLFYCCFVIILLRMSDLKLEIFKSHLFPWVVACCCKANVFDMFYFHCTHLFLKGAV